MPRGRCHFSLLLTLQKRLEAELPDVGRMTAQYLPDFLAGAIAPDAMRSLGRLGKLGSHFYAEEKRETWGKSVSGMFEAHPDLGDVASLPKRDQVLIMGYLSHLTADEAFRDEVTIHVHGIDNWRPIIHGLWSLVDELDIAHGNLATEIDRFQNQGQVGFISCDLVGQFLRRSRGWALHSDPVAHERVFLNMIEKPLSDEDIQKRLDLIRPQALPFFSEGRQYAFVTSAVDRAFEAIQMYAAHGYARNVGQ